MIKYDDILNDEYIIKIFNKIDQDEMGYHVDHGRRHTLKVVERIELIMRFLGETEENIELGKITGILHDIGLAEGKDNHEINSRDMAKEYFKNKDIDSDKVNIILNSIVDHRKGKNIQSNIATYLLMADKLDLDKTRLLKDGLDVEGARQIGNIEEVEITFDRNKLTVNFIVNELFNKEEFAYLFYFTKKVFDVVGRSCEYLNINNEFRINNEIFEL